MSIQPVEILRRYLDAIQNLDVEETLALLDDNAVIRMELMPPETPNEFVGIGTLRPVLTGFLGAFQSYRWTYAELTATDDPELAVARAGSAALLKNGREYSNDYCMFLRVRNGKITESREYFNPVKAELIFAP